MKLMNFRGHNAASLGAAVTILQRLSACLRPLAGAKRAEEERSRRPMDDQLSRYRQSIDNIDAALVYMLAERFKVTKAVGERSEEHTSELQSLMRISYAVFCLKKKK